MERHRLNIAMLLVVVVLLLLMAFVDGREAVLGIAYDTVQVMARGPRRFVSHAGNATNYWMMVGAWSALSGFLAWSGIRVALMLRKLE